MEPADGVRPLSDAAPVPAGGGRQSEVQDRFLRTLRSMHGAFRLDDAHSSAPLWTALCWFIGSAGPLDAELRAAHTASEL
ncbi:hypothetical protein [Streptomyces sp. NPDC059909]|uniref:hypothetical protein n=1 Tax=Streptomyces sp. NPDC059909 TaxID=3346998 RepID=UPI00365CED63